MKIYRKIRKKIVLLFLFLSVLYWIFGVKEKLIVCGLWSGDILIVLILLVNLENLYFL